MATSDGYALSVVESRSAEAQRSESAVLLLHGRTWSSQPVWVESGTLGGALGDRYTARGPPPRKRAARRYSSRRGNPDACFFAVSYTHLTLPTKA